MDVPDGVTRTGVTGARGVPAAVIGAPAPVIGAPAPVRDERTD